VRLVQLVQLVQLVRLLTLVRVLWLVLRLSLVRRLRLWLVWAVMLLVLLVLLVLLMAMASHALDARRGVRERRVLSGQWIDEDWLHAWRLENDRRVAEAVAQRGQALVLGKVDLADLLRVDTGPSAAVEGGVERGDVRGRRHIDKEVAEVALVVEVKR